MGNHQRLWGFLTTILAICIFSFPVLAATDVYVYLGSNQAWSDRNETKDTRSGKYSYVHAKCQSVYPDSGFDTFSTIQARIVDMYGILIGKQNTVSLIEGHDYSPLDIEEGLLNTTTVYFQFRGNTNLAANAIVAYDAL